MLTPAQVKNRQFTPAGRGSYKAVEVDEYLEEVAASYEQMFKENGELIRKIGLLADKVEEYRNDEDNIRAALLTAQRMAEKIIREAKEGVEGKLTQAQAQAEAMVAEATAKSNATLQEARGKADTLTTSAQAVYDKQRSDAERESQALLSEAQRRADEIVFEADRRAEEQLSTVKRSVMHESLVLEMAKKEVSEFRSNLMGLYKTHIELINRIPSIAQEHMQRQEEAAAQPEPVQPVSEQPEWQDAPQPAEEAAQAEEVVPETQPDPEVGEETQEAIKYTAQAPELAEDVLTQEQPGQPEDTADFSVKPWIQQPKAAGFRLRFDEIEESVPAPASDSKLKFGPDYDVFNEEDDEEEDDEGHTNLAFRGFFKRK